MSMDDPKHGVINQGKYRKRCSKIKWTDIEYHVQDNADFPHKDVKMYCDTKKIPNITFLRFSSKSS